MAEGTDNVIKILFRVAGGDQGIRGVTGEWILKDLNKIVNEYNTMTGGQKKKIRLEIDSEQFARDINAVIEKSGLGSPLKVNFDLGGFKGAAGTIGAMGQSFDYMRKSTSAAMQECKDLINELFKIKRFENINDQIFGRTGEKGNKQMAARAGEMAKSIQDELSKKINLAGFTEGQLDEIQAYVNHVFGEMGANVERAFKGDTDAFSSVAAAAYKASRAEEAYLHVKRENVRYTTDEIKANRKLGKSFATIANQEKLSELVDVSKESYRTAIGRNSISSDDMEAIDAFFNRSEWYAEKTEELATSYRRTSGVISEYGKVIDTSAHGEHMVAKAIETATRNIEEFTVADENRKETEEEFYDLREKIIKQTAYADMALNRENGTYAEYNAELSNAVGGMQNYFTAIEAVNNSVDFLDSKIASATYLRGGGFSEAYKAAMKLAGVYQSASIKGWTDDLKTQLAAATKEYEKFHAAQDGKSIKGSRTLTGENKADLDEMIGRHKELANLFASENQYADATLEDVRKQIVLEAENIEKQSISQQTLESIRKRALATGDKEVADAAEYLYLVKQAASISKKGLNSNVEAGHPILPNDIKGYNSFMNLVNGGKDKYSSDELLGLNNVIYQQNTQSLNATLAKERDSLNIVKAALADNDALELKSIATKGQYVAAVLKQIDAENKQREMHQQSYNKLMFGDIDQGGTTRGIKQIREQDEQHWKSIVDLEKIANDQAITDKNAQGIRAAAGELKRAAEDFVYRGGHETDFFTSNGEMWKNYANQARIVKNYIDGQNASIEAQIEPMERVAKADKRAIDLCNNKKKILFDIVGSQKNYSELCDESLLKETEEYKTMEQNADLQKKYATARTLLYGDANATEEKYAKGLLELYRELPFAMDKSKTALNEMIVDMEVEFARSTRGWNNEGMQSLANNLWGQRIQTRAWVEVAQDLGTSLNSTMSIQEIANAATERAISLGASSTKTHQMLAVAIQDDAIEENKRRQEMAASVSGYQGLSKAISDITVKIQPYIEALKNVNGAEAALGENAQKPISSLWQLNQAYTSTKNLLEQKVAGDTGLTDEMKTSIDEAKGKIAQYNQAIKDGTSDTAVYFDTAKEYINDNFAADNEYGVILLTLLEESMGIADANKAITSAVEKRNEKEAQYIKNKRDESAIQKELDANIQKQAELEKKITERSKDSAYQAYAALEAYRKRIDLIGDTAVKEGSVAKGFAAAGENQGMDRDKLVKEIGDDFHIVKGYDEDDRKLMREYLDVVLRISREKIQLNYLDKEDNSLITDRIALTAQLAKNSRGYKTGDEQIDNRLNLERGRVALSEYMEQQERAQTELDRLEKDMADNPADAAIKTKYDTQKQLVEDLAQKIEIARNAVTKFEDSFKSTSDKGSLFLEICDDIEEYRGALALAIRDGAKFGQDLLGPTNDLRKQISSKISLGLSKATDETTREMFESLGMEVNKTFIQALNFTGTSDSIIDFDSLIDGIMRFNSVVADTDFQKWNKDLPQQAENLSEVATAFSALTGLLDGKVVTSKTLVRFCNDNKDAVAACVPLKSAVSDMYQIISKKEVPDSLINQIMAETDEGRIRAEKELGVVKSLSDLMKKPFTAKIFNDFITQNKEAIDQSETLKKVVSDVNRYFQGGQRVSGSEFKGIVSNYKSTANNYSDNLAALKAFIGEQGKWAAVTRSSLEAFERANETELSIDRAFKNVVEQMKDRLNERLNQQTITESNLDDLLNGMTAQKGPGRLWPLKDVREAESAIKGLKKEIYGDRTSIMGKYFLADFEKREKNIINLSPELKAAIRSLYRELKDDGKITSESIQDRIKGLSPAKLDRAVSNPVLSNKFGKSEMKEYDLVREELQQLQNEMFHPNGLDFETYEKWKQENKDVIEGNKYLQKQVGELDKLMNSFKAGSTITKDVARVQTDLKTEMDDDVTVINELAKLLNTHTDVNMLKNVADNLSNTTSHAGEAINSIRLLEDQCRKGEISEAEMINIVNITFQHLKKGFKDFYDKAEAMSKINDKDLTPFLDKLKTIGTRLDNLHYVSFEEIDEATKAADASVEKLKTSINTLPYLDKKIFKNNTRARKQEGLGFYTDDELQMLRDLQAEMQRVTKTGKGYEELAQHIRIFNAELRETHGAELQRQEMDNLGTSLQNVALYATEAVKATNRASELMDNDSRNAKMSSLAQDLQQVITWSKDISQGAVVDASRPLISDKEWEKAPDIEVMFKNITRTIKSADANMVGLSRDTINWLASVEESDISMSNLLATEKSIFRYRRMEQQALRSGDSQTATFAGIMATSLTQKLKNSETLGLANGMLKGEDIENLDQQWKVLEAELSAKTTDSNAKSNIATYTKEKGAIEQFLKVYKEYYNSRVTGEDGVTKATDAAAAKFTTDLEKMKLQYGSFMDFTNVMGADGTVNAPTIKSSFDSESKDVLQKQLDTGKKLIEQQQEQKEDAAAQKIIEQESAAIRREILGYDSKITALALEREKSARSGNRDKESLETYSTLNQKIKEQISLRDQALEKAVLSNSITEEDLKLVNERIIDNGDFLKQEEDILASKQYDAQVDILSKQTAKELSQLLKDQANTRYEIGTLGEDETERESALNEALREQIKRYCEIWGASEDLKLLTEDQKRALNEQAQSLEWANTIRINETNAKKKDNEEARKSVDLANQYSDILKRLHKERMELIDLEGKGQNKSRQKALREDIESLSKRSLIRKDDGSYGGEAADEYSKEGGALKKKQYDALVAEDAEYKRIEESERKIAEAGRENTELEEDQRNVAKDLEGVIQAIFTTRSKMSKIKDKSSEEYKAAQVEIDKLQKTYDDFINTRKRYNELIEQKSAYDDKKASGKRLTPKQKQDYAEIEAELKEIDDNTLKSYDSIVEARGRLSELETRKLELDAKKESNGLSRKEQNEYAKIEAEIEKINSKNIEGINLDDATIKRLEVIYNNRKRIADIHDNINEGKAQDIAADSGKIEKSSEAVAGYEKRIKELGKAGSAFIRKGEGASNSNEMSVLESQFNSAYGSLMDEIDKAHEAKEITDEEYNSLNNLFIENVELIAQQEERTKARIKDKQALQEQKAAEKELADISKEYYDTQLKYIKTDKNDTTKTGTIQRQEEILGSLKNKIKLINGEQLEWNELTKEQKEECEHVVALLATARDEQKAAIQTSNANSAKFNASVQQEVATNGRYSEEAEWTKQEQKYRKLQARIMGTADRFKDLRKLDKDFAIELQEMIRIATMPIKNFAAEQMAEQLRSANRDLKKGEEGLVEYAEGYEQIVRASKSYSPQQELLDLRKEYELLQNEEYWEEGGKGQDFITRMAESFEKAVGRITISTKKIKGSIGELKDINAYIPSVATMNSRGANNESFTWRDYSNLADVANNALTNGTEEQKEQLKNLLEVLSEKSGQGISWSDKGLQGIVTGLRNLVVGSEDAEKALSSLLTITNGRKFTVGAFEQFKKENQEIVESTPVLKSAVIGIQETIDEIEVPSDIFKGAIDGIDTTGIKSEETTAMLNQLQRAAEQPITIGGLMKLKEEMQNMPQDCEALVEAINKVLAEANKEVDAKGLSEINAKMGQYGAQFDKDASQVSVATDTMMNKVKKSFGTNLVQKMSSMIMMSLTRLVRGIYTNVKELDSALAQLQIVTKNTEVTSESFANTLAKTAQGVATSITSLTESITTFARLGYSLSEATKLAEQTAKYSKVANVDVSDATTNITGIIKAFNISVNDLEKVLDELIVVGNNFAISSSELGEGLNNAAAALSANGNSLEQSMGILAAANATVQDVSRASTAVRTVAARLSNSTSELEELGEDTSEIKSTAALAKDMETFGVSILDVNGELLSTYDVLDQVAAKWDTYSNTAQASIAKLLAGTRQQAVFYSIIQNWDDAKEAVEACGEAGGELASSYNIYIDTIEGKLNQLSANWQSFSEGILDSGLVSGLITVVNGLLTAINWVTNGGKSMGMVIAAACGVITVAILSVIRSYKKAKKAADEFNEAAAGGKGSRLMRMLEYFKGVNTALKDFFTRTKKATKGAESLNGEVEKTGAATKNAQSNYAGLCTMIMLVTSLLASMSTQLNNVQNGAGDLASGLLMIVGIVVVAIILGMKKIDDAAKKNAIIAIIVMAIELIMSIVNLFKDWETQAQKTLRETKEDLDDAIDKLDEYKDKLEEISEAYDEIVERIEELQKKQANRTITAAEESELEKLQAQVGNKKSERDAEQVILDEQEAITAGLAADYINQLGSTKANYKNTTGVKAKNSKVASTGERKTELDWITDMTKNYSKLSYEEKTWLSDEMTEILGYAESLTYRTDKMIEEEIQRQRELFEDEGGNITAEQQKTLDELEANYEAENDAYEAAMKIADQYTLAVSPTGWQDTFNNILERSQYSDVKDFFDMISVLNGQLQSETLALEAELAKSAGTESRVVEAMVDTLGVSISDFMKSLGTLELTDDQLNDLAETLDMDAKAIEAVVAALNSIDDTDFADELDGINDINNTLEKTLKNLDNYDVLDDFIAHLEELGMIVDASDLANQLLSYNGSITSTIDTISYTSMLEDTDDAFDKLSSALDDITDSGIISSDTIQDMMEDYRDLVDEYFELTDQGYQLRQEYADLMEDNASAVLEDYAISQLSGYVDVLSDANEALAEAQEKVDALGEGLDEQGYPTQEYLEALEDLYVAEQDVENATTNLSRATSAMATQIRESELSKITDELQAQVDALDDQLDAYQDLIDIRKELLESYQDEISYQKELAEKTTSVSDLETQLAVAKLDNSAAGLARQRELQSELDSAREELDDFTLENAVDKVTNQLDKESDEFEKIINKQTDSLEDKMDEIAKNFQVHFDFEYDQDDNIVGINGFTTSYHTGGFVGDELKDNEEFAKLLKGEFVATPAMMENFMDTTLPGIATAAASGKSQGNVFNSPLISLTCEGITTESVPDVEKIVKKATEEIKKQLDSGFSRAGRKTKSLNLSL